MTTKPIRPDKDVAPQGFSDAASFDDGLYNVKKRVLTGRATSAASPKVPAQRALAAAGK